MRDTNNMNRDEAVRFLQYKLKTAKSRETAVFLTWKDVALIIDSLQEKNGKISQRECKGVERETEKAQ